MRASYLFLVIIFSFSTLIVAGPVCAGAPTEQIKLTTDKIISIVSDPALQDPARAKERKKRIRMAVDERFDWGEMSRRALARHWRKRTNEEKKEFISLFGQLLERTYLDKVEGYSGEKVLYEGETIDRDYGIVEVKIATAKDLEIPVKYRLRKKGDDWFVYDISIEGVSLINNYRVQFNSIVMRSSYKALIKKLKEKVAKEK